VLLAKVDELVANMTSELDEVLALAVAMPARARAAVLPGTPSRWRR
jgi:hypothetical protein